MRNEGKIKNMRGRETKGEEGNRSSCQQKRGSSQGRQRNNKVLQRRKGGGISQKERAHWIKGGTNERGSSGEGEIADHYV